MATGWERVGQLVREERIARGCKTYVEFRKVVHLSVGTLGNIEKARRTGYSAATKQQVEDALGWERGSIDRIVEGGQLDQARDPGLVRIISSWHLLQDSIRKVILDIVDGALRNAGLSGGAHPTPGDEG